MAQEVTKKAVITGIGIQTKGLLDRMSEEAAMERAAAAGFTCIDYNLNALLPEKTIREKTASLPGDTFFSLGEKEREDRLRPLKQAAHARGIRISQVHAPYPLHLIPDPEGKNEILKEKVLPVVFEAAAFLEAPFLVFHPVTADPAARGKERSAGNAEEELEKANEEFFRSMTALAVKYGIWVCIENICDPQDPKGTRFFEDPGAILRLARKLNAEAGQDLFGLCLDTGHLHVSRRDPGREAAAAGSLLWALHIHDNDGVRDLHQMPGAFYGRDERNFGIDWEGFAEGLRAAGFHGVLSLETYACVNSFTETLLPGALKLLYETAASLCKMAGN